MKSDITEKIKNLKNNYFELCNLIDDIPLNFKIFIDTSIIFFFPYGNKGNKNILDYISKCVIDPENRIFGADLNHEPVKLYSDYLSSFNKLLKEKDSFVCPEIDSEIKAVLNFIRERIKFKPLEMKMKRAKVHFKSRQYSDRNSGQYQRGTNRNVHTIFIKHSRHKKHNFYPNEFLFLLKKIKKNVVSLRDKLTVVPSLKEDQHFNSTKQFLFKYKDVFTNFDQPSERDRYFVAYMLEHSLINPIVCLSGDEHIIKLLDYANKNKKSYPFSTFFKSSQGLMSYRFSEKHGQLKIIKRLLKTEDRKIEFKNDRLRIYNQKSKNEKLESLVNS